MGTGTLPGLEWAGGPGPHRLAMGQLCSCSGSGLELCSRMVGWGVPAGRSVGGSAAGHGAGARASGAGARRRRRRQQPRAHLGRALPDLLLQLLQLLQLLLEQAARQQALRHRLQRRRRRRRWCRQRCARGRRRGGRGGGSLRRLVGRRGVECGRASGSRMRDLQAPASRASARASFGRACKPSSGIAPGGSPAA